MGGDSTRHLLIVAHSRTGNTARLVDAVLAGATDPAIGDDHDALSVTIDHRSPFELDADDLVHADGIVIATPANFGYMSGALKDLFDRTYRDVGDRTVGRPWALVVKGDTDPTGAVRSVERIVKGLGWRRVTNDVVVTGDITDEDLAAATELGGTMAAGLAYDLF